MGEEGWSGSEGKSLKKMMVGEESTATDDGWMEGRVQGDFVRVNSEIRMYERIERENLNKEGNKMNMKSMNYNWE